MAAEGMLADDSTYKLRRSPLPYMIDAYNERLKAIIDSISVDQGNGTLQQSLGRFQIKERITQNLGYAYFLLKVHKPSPPL